MDAIKIYLHAAYTTKYCRYNEMFSRALIKLWPLHSSCGLSKATRTCLVILFMLQLVSTLERQIFDFLGFMWAPIIGNFFQIIIVIIGIFGACNFSRSLVTVYATWSLLWLGWNIFVICLYLEVGILNRNRERYILTIGTEGRSWWLEHGIGCEVTNSSWIDQGSQPDTYVVGCILQYYYVEVIHAAVQCLLSLLGFVAACMCIYLLMEEDDYPMGSITDIEIVKTKHPMPAHLSSYLEGIPYDSVSLTTELSSSIARSRSRSDRESPPSYDSHLKDNPWIIEGNQNYYGLEGENLRSKTNASSKSLSNKQADYGAPMYSEPVKSSSWARSFADVENRVIRQYP